MNYYKLNQKFFNYKTELISGIDLRAKKRLTEGQKCYRYGYFKGVEDSDDCLFVEKLKTKYKRIPEEVAEKLVATEDIRKIAEYFESHGISYDVHELIKDYLPKWKWYV